MNHNSTVWHDRVTGLRFDWTTKPIAVYDKAELVDTIPLPDNASTHQIRMSINQWLANRGA
jgi:hypothetical protein